MCVLKRFERWPAAATLFRVYSEDFYLCACATRAIENIKLIYILDKFSLQKYFRIIGIFQKPLKDDGGIRKLGKRICSFVNEVVRSVRE